MQGQNKERWQELCDLVVKEQDPQKLVELAGEIARLLKVKLERIASMAPGQSKSSE